MVYSWCYHATNYVWLVLACGRTESTILQLCLANYYSMLMLDMITSFFLFCLIVLIHFQHALHPYCWMPGGVLFWLLRLVAREHWKRWMASAHVTFKKMISGPKCGAIADYQQCCVLHWFQGSARLAVQSYRRSSLISHGAVALDDSS